MIQVEAIIFDPSKINVKISKDIVESCFSPIVQSGGKYDIKVSASSNSDNLSPDVIICSLGARYKGYCANVSRTFMVDAPPKVEKTYALLVKLYDACLEKMIPGNELKDVLKEARSFLEKEKKDTSLASYLPKTLGFAIGLEFRDSSLVLNDSNTSKFLDGMIFNLSVGLQNVPLGPDDKAKSPATYQKISTFSLLLGDTVRIQSSGIPDILTRVSKEFADVSYNINEKVSVAVTIAFTSCCI
jgi:nucleosome binding factor SPN SPT16 subunit